MERATGCSIAPAYDAAAVARREAQRLAPGRHALRGLFCGGTLATEAQAVLAAAGLDMAANTTAPALRRGDGAPGAGSPAPRGLDAILGAGSPAPGAPDAAPGAGSPALGGLDATPGAPSPVPPGSNAPHTVIDFGADEYTVGRPHPMIDPALRTEGLREALADRQVAVVLLDVVLGLGAHPDPARPICDAMRDAGVDGEGPAVVASVCGTGDDPQHRERQVAMLGGAGVAVAPSNADAAAVAAAILDASSGVDPCS